jgi:hypothetical protein
VLPFGHHLEMFWMIEMQLQSTILFITFKRCKKNICDCVQLKILRNVPKKASEKKMFFAYVLTDSETSTDHSFKQGFYLKEKQMRELMKII